MSNLIALNDLENIIDVIRATQGSRYFTVIDLKEAFNHIEIKEDENFKTAFEFEGEVFELNSMALRL